MNWDGLPGYVGIGALVLVGIAILSFWIKMLVEAATESESSHRVAWMLIVFFGGLFGAIIYALIRRPQRIAEEQAADEEMLREMRIELSATSAGAGSAATADEKLVAEIAAACRRHRERG